MYKITNKEKLNEHVVRLDIHAPRVAKKALPGQFIMFRIDDKGERVPLTIADTDISKGTVTIILQTVGATTSKLAQKEVGDTILDFVGPLGIPTHVSKDIKSVCIVGGGVGCAIAFPQAKYLHSLGLHVDVIAGFRNKDLVILEEDMKANSTNLHVTTDDGSYGEKGFVTDKLKSLIDQRGKYDLVIAIGPVIMMKFVSQLTKEYGIKTIVSLNPLMIDGTGMCGCCRVTVDGKMKFACVDGPDFDGHLVDFDELMKRNATFTKEEKNAIDHPCNLQALADKKEEINIVTATNTKLYIASDYKKNMSNTKVPMPEQPGNVRNRSFKEVTLGYTQDMAVEEARRCLDCKTKPCVSGCPVNVKIPEFVTEVAKGNFKEAYEVLSSTNSLPAVCGRVCPQETQCEQKCVRGIKGEPVGIGRLERFVADWHLNNSTSKISKPVSNGKKVAVLGGGPSGLTCAGDLAKLGFEVTVYEAFHVVGGVLMYGIPEFRLPKTIVEKEISTLTELGVKFELNTIAGRTLTIDDLFNDNYKAVYIATGAGLPSFMKIEGEGLQGVYSANEYLTRINLMKGYLQDHETPIQASKKVVVVGGGNVAMDAARCAIRTKAEEVSIVYRRDQQSMPARLEEIHHAEAEEIKMRTLTNPVKILGDESGKVIGIECIKMELGEPDASGRRRPIAIEGSNFVVEADTVIMAIGTSPNPLVAEVTEGLETNKWGCIVVDDGMKTSLDKVYAGGDATVGAATVIYAMGCGKVAAKSIAKQLK